MNAPPALATRPPFPVAPLPADEDLGLAALLALFETEEPGQTADAADAATSSRPSLRSSGARLQAWTQEWLRRATAWGAGPGGAWRAW